VPCAYPGRYKQIVREANQEPRCDFAIVTPKYPKTAQHAKPLLRPSKAWSPPGDYKERHGDLPHRGVSTYTAAYREKTGDLRKNDNDRWDSADGRLCLEKDRRHYGSHGDEHFRPLSAPPKIREGVRVGDRESLASCSTRSGTSSSPRSVRSTYELKEGFSGHVPNCTRNVQRYGKTFGKAHDPRFSQAKHVSILDHVGTYPHVHICTAQTNKDADRSAPVHFPCSI